MLNEKSTMCPIFTSFIQISQPNRENIYLIYIYIIWPSYFNLIIQYNIIGNDLPTAFIYIAKWPSQRNNIQKNMTCWTLISCLRAVLLWRPKLLCSCPTLPQMALKFLQSSYGVHSITMDSSSDSDEGSYQNLVCSKYLPLEENN